MPARLSTSSAPVTFLLSNLRNLRWDHHIRMIVLDTHKTLQLEETEKCFTLILCLCTTKETKVSKSGKVECLTL